MAETRTKGGQVGTMVSAEGGGGGRSVEGGGAGEVGEGAEGVWAHIGSL